MWLNACNRMEVSGFSFQFFESFFLSRVRYLSLCSFDFHSLVVSQEIVWLYTSFSGTFSVFEASKQGVYIN